MNAFVELNNFAGTDSTADNDLIQDADVTQDFDVEVHADVTETTTATSVANAFNQSRFRHIEADLADLNAVGVFTSGQSQGTAANPLTMNATGNGGRADNDLTQTGDTGNGAATDNTILLTADFDLDLTETAALAPRTTELLVKMNELMGTNAAINSYQSSQEQSHAQNGLGGIDGNADQTENGGAADNQGTATLTHLDKTQVTNTVEVSI
jgi:hypothetical protein